MIRYRPLQRVVYSIVMLLLAVAPWGYTGPAAAASAGTYQYANGITLAAGSPLPLYKVTTPVVTKDTTFSLSQVFNGIYDRVNMNLQQDAYLGHARFTGLNEKNNTILEQYGATGGFYAFEPNRAFGDGSVIPNPTLDPAQAQLLACRFIVLHLNTLGPTSNDLDIPGLSVKCDHNFATDPLYKTSTETLSGQSVTPGSKTTNTPLRIQVTMPVLVNTGLHTQIPFIPMGGPGGHISMIFDTTVANPTAATPSLDTNITGLQAVAMPAFGRSLTFTRTAPAVDPAAAMDQVTQQVKASFPGASNISVPDPALVYFVTDAAQPQTLLEPDLVFSGVTVEVGGQTVVLKDIVVPGTEGGPNGVGPTITISSPVNGNAYFPGKTVSLKGEISNGTPPYTYLWQLDDGTKLGGGTLNSPGALPAVDTKLPLPDNKGTPAEQAIHLVVTDSEGATREKVVSLVTPIFIFLPQISKLTSGTSSTPGVESAPAPQDAPVTMLGPTNYRFGVEYGSDYPPYGAGGPDLGGVPPDANGLSAGLMGLGWPRVFNWYNANAWEKDWRDCSLGGIDCTYGVDRADYVYYSGHGSYGGISVSSNSHDSSWFSGTNARYQNARWVSFSSCYTLRAQWPTAGAEPIRNWFNAFRGAHMILGFNSVMADIAFGPRLVDNMRIPSFLGIEFPWAQRTIAQAWVQTAFEMNAGKPAYIYATSASVNPVGNKLPKVSDALLPRPYPVNWYYWVWWNE